MYGVFIVRMKHANVMNDSLFLLKNYSELSILQRLRLECFNDGINLPYTTAATGTSSCKFLNLRSCESPGAQFIFNLECRDMITKTDQSLLIHLDLIVKVVDL